MINIYPSKTRPIKTTGRKPCIHKQHVLEAGIIHHPSTNLVMVVPSLPLPASHNVFGKYDKLQLKYTSVLNMHFLYEHLSVNF